MCVQTEDRLTPLWRAVNAEAWACAIELLRAGAELTYQASDVIEMKRNAEAKLE